MSCDERINTWKGHAMDDMKTPNRNDYKNVKEIYVLGDNRIPNGTPRVKHYTYKVHLTNGEAITIIDDRDHFAAGAARVCYEIIHSGIILPNKGAAYGPNMITHVEYEMRERTRSL